MIGGHPHRLNAMQPLAAAQHMLVDKNGAKVQDEGELVFMGMRSATDGYMGSSSSKVTRDDECPTSERLHTGDVFNQVEPGWYQPVCRRDDLIVHTTGEMTNPLLIETRLKSLCDAVVANLCVFGQGQAKPFLVVQLREGMDEKATRSKVLEALAYLNATSKDLLIPASHVIWADAPLPTSAKGNVIRGQVEERYREHVNRGRSTPTSTLAWTQKAVATKQTAAHATSVGAAPDAGVADMLALVLSAVQACVGSAVSADAPLMDAGIDSLSAVELMEALQQIAGRSVRLSSTTLFDHPTARRLARFLAERAIHQPFAPPSAMRSSEDELPTLIVPVATLAQGWRAPGGTFSVLSCGCDLVGLADSARWDTVGEGVCSLPDEAKHARYAAFMCGVEFFDHSRFGMSSAEASVIDPQQRVLLEHSLQVFRGSVSHGMHTGVFLGAWTGDYADAVSSSPVMDSIHYLTGTGPSNMAGRIAFAFDLHGPCIAADAACSSALVAAHLASRTLEKNECQVGLTAGANIIFSPVFSVRMARAGMTSILGRYE